MSIRIITSADTHLFGDINALIPQLSSSTGHLSDEFLEATLAQESLTLLGYVDVIDGKEKLLGMLSLVTFTIPTGVRSWIEDVVVDSNARGRGIGEELVHAAVDLAAKVKKAKSVDLTSRPTREAANRLYQRAGFTPRETNIYRYSPEQA